MILHCRFNWILLVALSVSALPSYLVADELVYARDGSGVYGYRDTPKLPWCGYFVHDPDRPQPPRVLSGFFTQTAPPSDAVVLFDGRNLTQWQSNNWRIVENCLESVGAENLISKREFGSCQLHLEWMAPTNFHAQRFDRGNNGVMLMGLYEIQIFDSWNEKIYPDGQAAAIYGQTPPLVNACRPPGEWQSYDIAFRSPVFTNGNLTAPARVTMLHNGVLVHFNQEIHGETGHRIVANYTRQVSAGPLVLAGHNCPVRFRNIWLRPLTDTP